MPVKPQVLEKARPVPPTCVELFSGGGGLAVGIERAGFAHRELLEWNPSACETLRTNLGQALGRHGLCELIQGDVREFDFRPLQGQIDLVAGGPPCQPFSLGGKHQAFLDRRDMFPQAIRSVREIRPKAFVFENVKGLTRKSFATYFEYITLQLRYPDCTSAPDEEWLRHLARLERIHTKGGYDGLQYNLVFQVLNAADYGVPQKRERVFFVGFRSDLGVEWAFPEPTHSEHALYVDQVQTKHYWDRHNLPVADETLDILWGQHTGSAGLTSGSRLPWRTVRDALSGLPDPVAIGASGGKADHLFVPGARSYQGHTGSHIDAPSKTIKAGDHGVPGGENMIRFGDGSVRYYTIREAARVQTFPDTYAISGAWTEAMRQIGNAVPVRLAEVVGASVRKVI